MRQVSISEAVDRKFPEWVVFVVTRDTDGRSNLMPAGWCMFTSSNPPMLATAIGHGRYTHEILDRTGEFVISWPGEGQADLIEYSGSHSGRDVDKFAEKNLSWQPGSQTDVPLIEGCALHLECKVRGAHTTGDHTIFVGEIVAAHLPDTPIRKLENFGGEFLPAVPDRGA